MSAVLLLGRSQWQSAIGCAKFDTLTDEVLHQDYNSYGDLTFARSSFGAEREGRLRPETILFA